MWGMSFVSLLVFVLLGYVRRITYQLTLTNPILSVHTPTPTPLIPPIQAYIRLQELEAEEKRLKEEKEREKFHPTVSGEYLLQVYILDCYPCLSVG